MILEIIVIILVIAFLINILPQISEFVASVLETITNIISDIFKATTKGIKAVCKWVYNLPWYYKWLLFLAGVAVLSFFELYDLLCVWIIPFLWFFSAWVFDCMKVLQKRFINGLYSVTDRVTKLMHKKKR